MSDESRFLGIVQDRSAERSVPLHRPHIARLPEPTRYFAVSKRLFDILVALASAPAVVLIALALVVANPVWNRGPLLFAQKRMGRNCKPFTAYKFRTMAPCERAPRGPDDPVETHRITRLGNWLRKTRIDEFPQFFNVFRGDMSLVGPRPDQWDHARHYVATVPGYRDRHRVRPGITGLAQVAHGYAEGLDATAAKARVDLAYIRKANWGTDLRIILGTIRVMFTGFGAR